MHVLNELQRSFFQDLFKKPFVHINFSRKETRFFQAFSIIFDVFLAFLRRTSPFPWKWSVLTIEWFKKYCNDLFCSRFSSSISIHFLAFPWAFFTISTMGFDHPVFVAFAQRISRVEPHLERSGPSPGAIVCLVWHRIVFVFVVFSLFFSN